MQLHQVRIFCTVVECGSFSKAAEKLYITQPAISQQVKTLETKLGVPLLTRGTGELALTEAGQIVFRAAQQIFTIQDEARRMLDALQAGTRGQVLVGVSSTGVLYYLPPLLRQFRMAHPDVAVVMTSDITDRLRTAVVDGSLDVGLVWGPVVDPRLQAVPLHHATFAVVCAADHPLAGRPQVHPRDLVGHRFVMNLSGTTTRHFVESVLRGAGVVPEVAMEGTSTENIKKVVESGLGLALVARRAVAQEVVLGTLRILPVPELQTERQIALIVREGRQPSSTVSRFVQFVIQARDVLAGQEEANTGGPPAD